ncbi:FeoB-associated Cys-rich membrane protein [Tenacibaculum agarivorans]|uniref:FeoB-associated Cys-rich membrane protein n=1 Tax=Tenacibaculum agarivorans TaxID=1908389 RepID=UPI002936E117|nr:FeoB-associated Cys-rich membrane protein [Tenacibaculum agarivorans]
MATTTISWNGYFSIRFGITSLSIITMIQDFITYGIVIFAVLFLVRKFFFNAKSNKGCGPDCGCD